MFTEEINYEKTGKTPVWGKGDKATLKILNKAKLKGIWLNLASGDGRYNNILLRKANFVIASDINLSALKKLKDNTKWKYKKKLETKRFNIAKKFPFKNNSFEGIFCTGTLHLFSKEILRKITFEINRILKQKGRIIIDFATDIKRTKSDGSLLIFDKEPLYSHKEAEKLLKKLFSNYKIKIVNSGVIEYIKEANPPYTLNCKFIILMGNKK